MNGVGETPYDEVPYDSLPYGASHPDRLATIGTLFGMEPAPIDACRVLELGCASGGNIIPMAEYLPGGRFLGIDSSRRQIADGVETIRALGFENIELRHCDILDVAPEVGVFDYVICHGVYSWVPNVVQEKILSICAENLAPQGIAYVSYNTYPGWYLRGMIRDMMRYHVRGLADPPARIRQAKAWLDFLVQAVPTRDNAYGLLLKAELERLASTQESYLYHEHLEDVNEPTYFHDFVERAQGHGLQYLGEAQFSTMVASNFAPEVERTLQQVAPDLIALEQYMDFVRNRQFRASLLCRRGVRLVRDVWPEKLMSLYVACPSRPAAAAVDVRNSDPARFLGLHDLHITTSDSIVIAALLELGESWPQALRFDDLLGRARARLHDAGLGDRLSAMKDSDVLASSLLRCYAANAIELRARMVPLTLNPGGRPLATAYARFQAGRGGYVTNLRHEIVQLKDFIRNVLCELDGTRTVDELVAFLAASVMAGSLVVPAHGSSADEGSGVRPVSASMVHENLAELARCGLLRATRS
jgi:methyltransferase-like protein/SAM-dependent methyltransferase